MRLKYQFEMMELDDKVIAVPVGENADKLSAVLQLNETASAIIALLREDINEEEIIKSMLKTYDVEREELSVYLKEFLTELKNADLLEQ